MAAVADNTADAKMIPAANMIFNSLSHRSVGGRLPGSEKRWIYSDVERGHETVGLVRKTDDGQ